MAIFPTNPPSHNVSCDDLFKKQARQFLSTPEPPVVKRESNMASAGHDSMRGEPATNGYDANRAAMDPNYRHQSQQYAHSPAQSHGSPDSRPQTRNRPPTRMEGASPVIYQFEVCGYLFVASRK